MFRIFSAILALSLCSVPALSHSWYDAICCSDRDCVSIAPKNVKKIKGGYSVTLMPGEHSMLVVAGVTSETTFFVTETRIKRSMDFEHHACISPVGQMLCLYVAAEGM